MLAISGACSRSRRGKGVGRARVDRWMKKKKECGCEEREVERSGCSSPCGQNGADGRGARRPRAQPRKGSVACDPWASVRGHRRYSSPSARSPLARGSGTGGGVPAPQTQAPGALRLPPPAHSPPHSPTGGEDQGRRGGRGARRRIAKAGRGVWGRGPFPTGWSRAPANSKCDPFRHKIFLLPPSLPHPAPRPTRPSLQ
jgi:hypothetical protein